MSWGIVERVRDKSAAVPPIDEILAGIPDSGKLSTTVWPFVDDEQDPAADWVQSIQPRTDVQVRFQQFFAFDRMTFPVFLP
jgi:hypothetical protein